MSWQTASDRWPPAQVNSKVEGFSNAAIAGRTSLTPLYGFKSIVEKLCKSVCSGDKRDTAGIQSYSQYK